MGSRCCASLILKLSDIHERESDLTDVDVPLAALNTTLFPGISSDVEVHSGFQDEHALTADVILAEVQSLMSSKATNNIVAVCVTRTC